MCLSLKTVSVCRGIAVKTCYISEESQTPFKNAQLWIWLRWERLCEWWAALSTSQSELLWSIGHSANIKHEDISVSVKKTCFIRFICQSTCDVRMEDRTNQLLRNLKNESMNPVEKFKRHRAFDSAPRAPCRSTGVPLPNSSRGRHQPVCAHLGLLSLSTVSQRICRLELDRNIWTRLSALR